MPTNFFSSEPEPESQIPERPSRREPLVVKEHETFVLTATMAAPSVAAVTWLKDGVEIRRSKRHEATSLGDTHTLTVRGAQVLDSAIYSCRVGKEGQDFPVQVEGKQRLGGQTSGSPPGSLCLLQRLEAVFHSRPRVGLRTQGHLHRALTDTFFSPQRWPLSSPNPWSPSKGNWVAL